MNEIDYDELFYTYLRLLKQKKTIKSNFSNNMREHYAYRCKEPLRIIAHLS